MDERLMEKENEKKAKELFFRLPEETQRALLDVALKISVIQSLDDGFGRVIVELQRGKIFMIRLIEEKIVKPTKEERFYS